MRGGARLGAGRKPHLEDKTIEQICRMSASSILHAFRDPSIKLEFKAQLGRDFIIRKMPSNVALKGELKNSVVFIANEAALKELGIDAEKTPLLTD